MLGIHFLFKHLFVCYLLPSTKQGVHPPKINSLNPKMMIWSRWFSEIPGGVLYSQVNQALIFRPCIHELVTSSDRTKPSRKSSSEVNPPTHHASPLHIQRRAPLHKGQIGNLPQSSGWNNEQSLKPPPRKGLQRSFSYEVWSRPTHLPPPPKRKATKNMCFLLTCKDNKFHSQQKQGMFARMLDWFHRSLGQITLMMLDGWVGSHGLLLLPGSRGKFSGLPVRDLSISSVQGTEIMLIFEICLSFT